MPISDVSLKKRSTMATSQDIVRSIAEMSRKLDTFMQQHRDEIRSSQQFNRAIMTEMKALVEHIVGERTTT